MRAGRRFVVDVRGYGRVSTCYIEATSKQEAVKKAAAKYGIEIKVRP